MSSSVPLPTGMAGLQYPITQVSLAVRDLDRTMAQYHRAFGWAPWQVFDHVSPVHHATQLRGRPVDYSLRGAEVYVGSLNFELLQPLSGPVYAVSGSGGLPRLAFLLDGQVDLVPRADTRTVKVRTAR